MTAADLLAGLTRTLDHLSQGGRLFDDDPQMCAREHAKARDLLGRDAPVVGDDQLVAIRTAGDAHSYSVNRARPAAGNQLNLDVVAQWRAADDLSVQDLEVATTMVSALAQRGGRQV